MLRTNMLCVYRVGFVLLVLTSVSVQDNIKKKMVSKVEDEGLFDEIARYRRDFRKSSLRIDERLGDEIARYRRDFRKSNLRIDEGLGDEVARYRRGFSKSNLRIGMFSPLICEGLRRRKLRKGREVKRDTRQTQLGFFNEIQCRRLHNWFDHGKENIHGYRMRDCQDVQSYYGKRWSRSGDYVIHPTGGKKIKVYCDMKTDGGGWTSNPNFDGVDFCDGAACRTGNAYPSRVFQHRYDGSVNFYRTWQVYKIGFGNVNKEFWLGNDNIHRMTHQGKYKLRIEMEDFVGNKRYAEYSSFRVADESKKYRVSFGSYSGTAGNSFVYDNNCYFSTKDKNNSRRSCVVARKGAWWHGSSCTYANLNGLYKGRKISSQSNFWYNWPAGKTNVKTSTMMIRKM